MLFRSIGSLVRTANAFNVAGVHIIGNKHWNQHGALMTDKYIEMHHHASATDFRSYTEQNSLQVIGFDNVPGAVALDHFTFPPNSVLLFGNEGTGLTPDAVEISDALVEITQYGSVRSMNASAAGAIALYAWMAQHRPSAS